MGMTFSNLCNSCTNIGCEFQSGIVRTKCAFYMPPHIESDNCGNYVVQDSTTKNDCAEQNGCISCSLDDGDDCCRKLYEESMQDSTTKNDIRDNRVKNELNRVKDELEPTTKNDLEVDWESYKDVDGNSLDDLILEVLQNNFDCGNTYGYKVADEIIGLLPSVTPQEHRWIPMVRREPTEEEKAEYLAQNGEELCYMLENEMPLNGQEVLVSIGEFVSEDIFDEDFYNFENNDVENVDAWMPLPKPYGLESGDKE